MKPNLSGTRSTNDTSFGISSAGSSLVCPAESRRGNNFKLALLVTTLMLWSSQAWSIAIFQHSAFIHSSDLGPDSLEETSIGFGSSEFSGAGLDFTFTESLDANNYGSLSWEVTNNTGSDLSDVSFFGFLDADIDEPLNTFFNESGALVSVLGTGAGDTAVDSWEIDEPGFVFGDVFDNLLDGVLDNSNGVPAGSEDDVSLALGFDIGTLSSGQSLLATFVISLENIGGLNQTDPDSNTTFYYNGSVALQDIGVVPAPAAVWLFGTALIGLVGFGKRRKAA
jgi:hypothetical protein